MAVTMKEVNDAIRKLATELRARLSAAESRVGTLEVSVSGFDARIDALEASVVTADRVQALEAALEGIDARLDALEPDPEPEPTV